MSNGRRRMRNCAPISLKRLILGLYLLCLYSKPNRALLDSVQAIPIIVLNTSHLCQLLAAPLIFTALFNNCSIIVNPITIARPDKASKLRKHWNWYHYSVGRVLIVLAIANIFYEISFGEDDAAPWNIGYGVALGFLATTQLDSYLLGYLDQLGMAKLMDLFQRRYAHSVIIGVGLMVFQQFDGINGIIFYTSDIFVSAGFSSGKLGTIAMAVIQVPITALGTVLMDKSGRRPLLLMFATGTFFGCLLAGTSLYLKVGEDEFGYMLVGILKENNVNNEGMRFVPGARTALAFVTLKANGEREFMLYRNPSADMLLEESELDLDIIKKVVTIYYIF